MGKKRAAAAITTMPVFPFPAAAADEPEPPHHFSDYGFDPQLPRFSQVHSQPESKQAAARRHHQTPPLEPARFKLQKPISKKHQHAQHNELQRRRWWSSAASAALLFFKRSSSNPTTGASSTASPSSYKTAAAVVPRPLYFADDGDDDATGCTCWAPTMRSGHMAAAEFGAASAVISYVSLRDVNLGGGTEGARVGAPAMPIYLVT